MLILITDHGHLKAFRLEKTDFGTPHLEPIHEEEIQEAHSKIIDQVTDLAGRHGKPTHTDWGGLMGDDHHLRAEVNHKALKHLASSLNAISKKWAEENICLIAPPQVLNPLIELLPSSIKTRIQFQIRRDLIKANYEQLLKVLKEHGVIH